MISKKLAVVLSLIVLFFPLLSSAQTAEPTAFLFRLFHPRLNDHFYTTSESERNAAIRIGYRDEGIVGSIFTTQIAGTTPMFRLFNSRISDHFYTTSATERQSALTAGYVSEGTTGFLFTTGDTDRFPLYRLFSPSRTDHLYTVSIMERVRLTDLTDYVFEGTIGFLRSRLFNQIRVQNIVPGQQIQSPLVVQGTARGTWFFEASFPISVFTLDGRKIGQGVGLATQNAMTTDFVNFQSTPIQFQVPAGVTEGFVILQKDNPSGLPQNADELIIPVRF